MAARRQVGHSCGQGISRVRKVKGLRADFGALNNNDIRLQMEVIVVCEVQCVPLIMTHFQEIFSVK